MPEPQPIDLKFTAGSTHTHLTVMRFDAGEEIAD
jgi:hypothetical protein